MSITFSSNASETRSTKQEHCLCAQMAEGFMGDATPEALRAAADPQCHFCGGSGIETVPTSDLPELNLANGNAMSLLGALRIEPDYCGSLSIEAARRAVIRARNSSLQAFVRPEVVEHGKPRVLEDGTIQMRPLRLFAAGLSEEGLEEFIARFAALVEASAERGATEISWG